jgi:uncharacterized protein (TIGR02301 family)
LRGASRLAKVRAMRRAALLLAMLAAATLAAPALAQTTGAAPNAPPASSMPGHVQGATPYEGQLLRLAEVLGALHHLRAICGGNDGTLWRDRMQALVQSDAPTGERRDRLAGAFNASYRTYARSYASCTPAAEQVIRKFLAEGARISREVATRYSN